MKRFRNVIFWCHLIAGTIAGLVILIMSFTGAMLAFQPQILEIAEREMMNVKQQEGRTRLSPQRLMKRFMQQQPDSKPFSSILSADPATAAVINLRREGVAYQDPYSGDLTGEGAKGWRSFFREVTDLHRWLSTEGENRKTGRSITGACNLAFLFLASSGIYLWWPKKWIKQYLFPIITFQSGLKNRARDFNWHNVTGIWCSLLLILIISTGLVMSYTWANNLLYTLTGNVPPAVPGKSASEKSRASETSTTIPKNLDELFLQAEKQSARWKTIGIRFSSNSRAPISVTITEEGSEYPFVRSQLTLKASTAEVLQWEPYDSLNAGRKLRFWARYVHTGEAAGWIGQTVACVVSLGGTFLVWTGLSLALRRFRAWRTQQ